MADVSIGNF
jgi:hypothetical protein